MSRSPIVVQGSLSIDGGSGDTFDLIGANASLSLTDNTNSSINMLSNNEYLTLVAHDGKENVFLYGGGDGITLSGLLAGVTDVYGFGNGTNFFTLAGMAPSTLTIKPDGDGGTLVKLASGGRLDFMGDSRVGVVIAPHGTTSILGNV